MTPPIRERVDQPRNWREDDGKKPLVGKLLCSSWHEVNTYNASFTMIKRVSKLATRNHQSVKL